MMLLCHCCSANTRASPLASMQPLPTPRAAGYEEEAEPHPAVQVLTQFPLPRSHLATPVSGCSTQNLSTAP